MLHQLRRLIAKMARCSHIEVRVRTKLCSEMVKIMKLCTSSVVNEHYTNIIAYMPVTQHIHIIEKCQVAHNSKTQFLRIDQRCTNQS